MARLTAKADAVIIGAGLAGLTAGALLSKQGHRVTVLERDIHPGGCAASFEKQGYRFAVGATVAMGLEPGGLVRQIYERLDLKPEYHDVSPAIRVHLPDRKVHISTTQSDWEAEILRAFPGQAERKLAFWHEVRRLASAMHSVSRRFPVMPFRRLRDLLNTAMAARPQALLALLYLHRNVEDRLNHYGIDDPHHRAFIDGQLLDAMQTTAENCVAANGALALGIYRYGCQYKMGALSSIAEDYAAFIKQQGGSVHYATKAKAIHYDKTGIKAVSTNQGDIDTTIVISAIPLENTSSLLGPRHPDMSARAESGANMWGAFTLYLGIDERCLPKDHHIYEQITDLDTHGTGNLLISTSPAYDHSRAPEGKRAITISTHVSAASWLKLAQDKEAYATAKAKMESRILDQVERAIPKIRDGIELLYSGSPRTFRNFTLRAGGTVGGFPQTLAAANFQAPSHHSSIPGLFLAGDTIFPGQGVLGVSVSGHNAARSAARQLIHHKKPSTIPQQEESYAN